MVKTSKFVKYLLIGMIVSVTVYSLFYNLNYYSSFTSLQGYMQPKVPLNVKLRYILVWTSIMTDPIMNLGYGNQSFLDKKCSINTCYVTSNRTLFKDVADFDVILFHGPELKHYNTSQLPQSRSPHQKYIFASMESSVYYPICNKMYNSYFNWTWTYKLKSDEYYGYISVKDKEGKVVGPKEEMHWEKVEDMMPINDTLKAKLSTKKIAVAWFVSNCGAPSKRDLVAKELQNELAKYNMTVDIIGRCGTKKCPKDNMEECLRKVETDYYFYLAFENTFGEDYVTEKLLHALNHYAVPVVFGGANYTRFMPDGMYLSAHKQSISELAKKMVDIIRDKQKYYDYFKWHNHYSYSDGCESPETNPYCRLCALINNSNQYLRTSVYDDFSKWWSPDECYNNPSIVF